MAAYIFSTSDFKAAAGLSETLKITDYFWFSIRILIVGNITNTNCEF